MGQSLPALAVNGSRIRRIDLTQSIVFFFWLNPDEGADYGEQTPHYSNISTPGKVFDSTPASSASSSAPPSASPLSTGTTVMTSISSATSPMQTTTSNPTFEKTGLRVGLGVGIPLLAITGVLIWFVIRRYNSKRDSRITVTPEKENMKDPPPEYARKNDKPTSDAQQSDNVLSELPDELVLPEMSSLLGAKAHRGKVILMCKPTSHLTRRIACTRVFS